MERGAIRSRGVAAAVVGLAACGGARTRHEPAGGPWPSTEAGATAAPEPAAAWGGAPERVIAVRTEGCVATPGAIPGEAAADPALLAVVTAHPWCRSDGAGARWVALRPDGTMRSITRAAADGGPAVVVADSVDCWGLSGAQLLVRESATRWNAWTVTATGDGERAILAWRGASYAPCAAPPPTDTPPGDAKPPP